MERNQFWIFLALGLAVGGCLEAMKAPSTIPTRLAGFTHFETLLEEGKEVHVVEEVKPIFRRGVKREEDVIVPQKIAANDTPTAEVMAPNEDPAATPAPKPLTPEEKKKKDEEDKKKKELEKKKRLKAKKKKLEEEKKQRESLEAQAKEDEEKKDAKADDTGNTAATTPEQPPAPAHRPLIPDDGLPKTVVEWEAYLMKYVDFERMATFVKLYQIGTVKHEVFYPVIEAMMQDSRAGIRSLAVGGLSSAPSTQSYITLLEIRNDADLGVRASAKAGIGQYSRLENLRYLMNVIVGSYEPSVVIEAMNTVKTSAETNVKGLSITAQGTTTRAPAATALAKYYAPFVTALQQTSTRNHDPAVRSSATQTLADLQLVVATISQAAAQTTASNQQTP